MLTVQAILVPITASRTSNLLRAIATLFGVQIAPSRYYTFMASVKRRWGSGWEVLWRAIPNPLTAGRLLVALDDAIHPKTGRQVFGGQPTFDPAAKTHHSQYPWAPTMVTVGLLKVLHGRWSCLPLAFACYLRRQTLRAGGIRVRGEAGVFQRQFAPAVRLIAGLAKVFGHAPILVVADSWFGNHGWLKPWRAALGPRAHRLSRLRVNAVRYEQPTATPGAPGRPRQYGARLGNTAQLAAAVRVDARTDTINRYGKRREVIAAERLVMLKTLRCQVRVVWVFRKTPWVALVTTAPTLAVAQLVEYYGARWKIEAGFREIKQEIGRAETQTRHPDAVTHHLNFCMAATTMTWSYGAQLHRAPPRRDATAKRTEYAFADLRRALAKDLGGQGFGIDCRIPGNATRNPLIATVMDLVA